MKTLDIHLTDGRLFATGYNRVEHGGRGHYVEFTKDQIILPLKSKHGQDLPEDILGTEQFYYYWLIPEIGFSYKVYWQAKPVTYANYRIGLYYSSPNNFKENILLHDYDTEG
jgi:hypothetical protein